MPILLIPGLGGSPQIYAPVAAALWGFGPVTVANHVRDDNIGAIARRILAEAPPRFALAGHSMGGYVALEIMTGSCFAGAVSQVVLIGRVDKFRFTLHACPVARTAGTVILRCKLLRASKEGRNMRGQRSSLSRREALILQTLISHPWLLHDHLEETASLELAHPEAHKLRAGILAAFANCGPTDDIDVERTRIREWVEKNGYLEQIQRVERAITTGAVWGAQTGAAREDVLSTWHQLVVLHRQWHSLLRELKDAELALGDEASDANLGWLLDVKARLAEVDGTEALIEGFGESSGRFQRSMKMAAPLSMRPSYLICPVLTQPAKAGVFGGHEDERDQYFAITGVLK